MSGHATVSAPPRAPHRLEPREIEPRFKEFLATLATSRLPAATRRAMWLRVLDAYDRAVAEGRVGRDGGRV